VGGGWNWTKLPNITITADDVMIDRITANPDDFADYVEGFDWLEAEANSDQIPAWIPEGTFSAEPQ
jgi:hypothetical protein